MRPASAEPSDSAALSGNSSNMACAEIPPRGVAHIFLPEFFSAGAATALRRKSPAAFEISRWFFAAWGPWWPRGAAGAHGGPRSKLRCLFAGSLDFEGDFAPQRSPPKRPANVAVSVFYRGPGAFFSRETGINSWEFPPI